MILPYYGSRRVKKKLLEHFWDMKSTGVISVIAKSMASNGLVLKPVPSHRKRCLAFASLRGLKSDSVLQ